MSGFIGTPTMADIERLERRIKALEDSVIDTSTGDSLPVCDDDDGCCKGCGSSFIHQVGCPSENPTDSPAGGDPDLPAGTKTTVGKTTSDRCANPLCDHTRYVHIPGGGCDVDAHYKLPPCGCIGFAEPPVPSSIDQSDAHPTIDGEGSPSDSAIPQAPEGEHPTSAQIGAAITDVLTWHTYTVSFCSCGLGKERGVRSYDWRHHIAEEVVETLRLTEAAAQRVDAGHHAAATFPQHMKPTK